MKCSQWNVNLALTWTRCSLCDSLLMWCMSQGRGPCHYSLRGGGEGVQEKKADLIPTTAVLLWYHDQAVFVFRVGRDIFVFVYLCVCVCLCIGMCFGVCRGFALQTCWYRDGDRKEGGWPCLIWHEVKRHEVGLFFEDHTSLICQLVYLFTSTLSMCK